MMEMVVLGVTIVIGMVLAQGLMFYGTMRLMLNKKFMIKMTKKYVEIVTEVTEEVTEDLLKSEAE